MTPRQLYDALRYQLQPVTGSTRGPCANGCGQDARGSAVCATCLALQLREHIGADAIDLLDKLRASRDAIVRVEGLIWEKRDEG